MVPTKVKGLNDNARATMLSLSRDATRDENERGDFSEPKSAVVERADLRLPISTTPTPRKMAERKPMKIQLPNGRAENVASIGNSVARMAPNRIAVARVSVPK